VSTEEAAVSRTLFAGLICLGFLGGAAQAQSDYPNRPVKIIVPSTPGGGSDTFARLVAQHLSESLGQQFYIDNRPGGGTLIGMEAAVNSGADGYTLYLAPSTITLLPLVKKKLSVSLANFEPISLAAILPQVLMVNPSIPAKDVAEFVALAKKEPGKLTYGSPGIGTGPQMAMQLFINSTGIELLHIPYKGVANVLTDLLAGRVSSMMLNMLTAKPHVESGKLRALGVTSARRVSGMDAVPTIAEQGLKGYEALQWFAFFAPKGTPKAIVEKIQREMAKGLHSPKVKQQLAIQGAEPGGNTPVEFAAFLKAESDKWAAVAKAAKIVPQ
jgi:tripartite-type tricarboxylate transporter receptor subunit TctC